MSSIPGHSHNVILFVGRPTDSRKGLALLFESVGILAEMPDLPRFHVWIVGGSPREVAVISRMADQISATRSLRENGRFMVWGRVENSALSELFSRALITVMPSYREEFGIVAVEAMMCGCPVVAANTGGLQDLVAEGAGALFAPDDAAAMAAVIAAYLRNPDRRGPELQIAREKFLVTFSRNMVFEKLVHLYQSDPYTSGRAGCAVAAKRQPVLENRLLRIKRALNDDGILATPISTSRHPVFRVTSRGDTFVAKIFVPRHSHQASLFPCQAGLSSERGGMVSYNRVLYNRDNPVSATILHAEPDPEPLVLFHWSPPAFDGRSAIADEVVYKAIHLCQSYKPVNDKVMSDYVETLNNFSRSPNEETIRAYDVASARLNSCMTDGRLILCRSHPQIELARLRSLLTRRMWPVPDAFRVRASQLIDILLGNWNVVVDRPVLAHGDPKPDHCLAYPEEELRLADFEHSRYAVGPLDLALWFCASALWSQPRCNAQEMWARIAAVLTTPKDRYLCVCWVVAEALFVALLEFSSGDRKAMTQATNLLGGFGLLLSNQQSFRNDEEQM